MGGADEVELERTAPRDAGDGERVETCSAIPWAMGLDAASVAMLFLVDSSSDGSL